MLWCPKDIVPEVEVTSNNDVVPELLIQFDDAQHVELIRICPDPTKVLICAVLLRATWRAYSQFYDEHS